MTISQNEILQKLKLIEQILSEKSNVKDDHPDLSTSTKSKSEPINYKFTMNDCWNRLLIKVLLGKYGYSIHRKPGQRHNTVCTVISPQFVDEVLWPEYLDLSEKLDQKLEKAFHEFLQEMIVARKSQP